MPYTPLNGRNTVNDVIDRLNAISNQVDADAGGDVVSPNPASDGALAVFADATGKVIVSGPSPQSSSSDATAGKVLLVGAKLSTLGNDVAGKASPDLTGTPTAPTAAPGTNTTQVATTAFVTAADNLKANLASPALSGVPTAPTASTGTVSTQLATTAFVADSIFNAGDSFGSDIPSATSIVIGTVAAGDSIYITGTATIANFGSSIAGTQRQLYIKDGLTITHGASTIACPNNVTTTFPAGTWIQTVCTGGSTWKITGFQHANVTVPEIGYLTGVSSSIQTQLNTKAPLVSPALTGVPTAPTAAPSTNTTQVATTAFVTTADALKANSDSPALTGVPTAPTAAPGTNTTQLATTAFVTTADNLKVNSSLLGVANGVATLDASGLVPSVQLPSYVDDVLEFANLPGFPVTGESGKIYVALDTNKTYRWSGSAYVYITSGAVDSVAGKTGVVSLVKADVGLGSVDNTSDAAKPVSTSQQTALNLKANLASPALTGTPTAPTAAPGTNTTQVATTAFVTTSVSAVDLTNLSATNLTSGIVPDARISGSYTGLTNLTGSGNVDFAKFLGNAAGTVGAPSYSWTGDTNTGMYAPAADQIGFTTGGVQRLLIDSSGLTGVGTGLTALDATNITIGTIPSARVPTLNQNTTGSSGSCTGNAATATKLATARTINGVAFDGSANITIAVGETGRLPLTGGTLTGGLTLSSTAIYITFNDTDWGVRHIHSNSGSIGFLNSSGDWSLWNDNAGNTTSAGNVTAYSDIRLKTDIQLIPDALEKVCTLRGVTYERIETGERQTGVIAQEVQAVLPEAVMIGTDENETLSVAYGNMVGLLIEAIKELKARVEELESK